MPELSENELSEMVLGFWHYCNSMVEVEVHGGVAVGFLPWMDFKRWVAQWLLEHGKTLCQRCHEPMPIGEPSLYLPYCPECTTVVEVNTHERVHGRGTGKVQGAK